MRASGRLWRNLNGTFVALLFGMTTTRNVRNQNPLSARAFAADRRSTFDYTARMVLEELVETFGPVDVDSFSNDEIDPSFWEK
jgi:hypothetical protein